MAFCVGMSFGFQNTRENEEAHRLPISQSPNLPTVSLLELLLAERKEGMPGQSAGL
jgi:hypothetical protein